MSTDTMPVIMDSKLPPASTIVLISASATFGIAIFETIVFNGLDLVAKADKRSAARTISLWWKVTYFHGLSMILILGTINLVSGITTIIQLPLNSVERRIAIAATIFAAGHFAMAKPVVATINAMCAVYDGKDDTAGATLDSRAVDLNSEWLKWHLIRTFTTDVPALLCWAYLALL